jgi:hypothetical protein
MAHGGLGFMTGLRADILITDRDGTPVAAVEVKNRQHLTPQVAAVLRRNLMVHGYVPSTPYYLLLSQDVGYLWKYAPPPGGDVPPDYQFSLDAVVARYLKSEPKRWLSGAELELVVLQWLIELTLDQREPTEEPEKTLAASGFLEAIRGGRVVAEAVA